SDDVPVAQRQVEQRKLAVQMIAQRAGGDLLRQEVVVVVRIAAAPVAVAAAAAVIGEVDDFGSVVARRANFGSGLAGDTIMRGVIDAVADTAGTRQRHFGRNAIFFGFGALEER